jgi:hypothetical protein
MSYTKTEDWTTLPAALLPVVKDQLRIDFDDDNAIITRHIQWAIGYCQDFTGLQIFEADVAWTPGSACSRYQCPAQPVSAFTVTSDAVDVSADYALDSGALTSPVWLVRSDGTPFAADAAVTLTAGYADADLIPPNLYGNLLRVSATLYENRESISAISLDQVPFWLNDMIGGLWLPRC